MKIITTEDSFNDLKISIIKLGIEIKKAFLSDIKKIKKFFLGVKNNENQN